MRFEESRLKIERANKHIGDINYVVTDFISSDFYSLRIDKKPHGMKCLRVECKREFPSSEIAIVIGDALHNLRSSLDIAYCKCVVGSEGKVDDQTQFPIKYTREKLKTALDKDLEKEQITEGVHHTILEVIKPCKAGNYPIWALHRLNIIDKHQLLVPMWQLVSINQVCLQDSKGAVAYSGDVFIDGCPRVRGSRPIKVKEHGHPSASVLFGIYIPFGGKPIIPSLNRVSEEVTRTIEALETLFS